jgi:hypothetical protein
VKQRETYLSGQYVCLTETTPQLLHTLVDELDAQTAEFTAYDRLRFGGPVSRDTLINDVRMACPRQPAERISVWLPIPRMSLSGQELDNRC